MKLIAVTEQYGDRVMIRPVYGQALFFAGRQPAAKEMILLEMPGLKEITNEAIMAWLTQHQPPQGPGLIQKFLGKTSPSPRRQINEIDGGLWRRAVLDDMLEVQNYYYFSWNLPDHFSLAEFSAFFDRWLPQTQERLHQVLTTSSDQERASQLATLSPFLERVATVVQQTPRRVFKVHHDLLREFDQAQVKLLHQGQFEPKKWLDLAAKLHTAEVALDLLYEVAGQLAKPNQSQAYIHQVLTTIQASTVLKQLTTNAPLFWQRLKHALRLESNISGQTIDISQAEEQTVALGWPVVEARRVGRIIPGRAALMLRDEAGQLTYIAGERKLKFQIAGAGGQIKKFGNTLTASAVGSNLRQALLEVELLDTLANVDPPQALQRIESLHLPPEHPVFQAARSVAGDPRQSRILADLLIELTLGIDADVARRLVRAQARPNRR